jgi:WD40 repeat protein
MVVGDVKLKDDGVSVEGDLEADGNVAVKGYLNTDKDVNVRGWQIVLDSALRRSNSTPARRALVHDVGDKLTVNCLGDYPNGVEVQSNVKVTGTDLLIDNASRRRPNAPAEVPRRALCHGADDWLVMNAFSDYSNGVRVESNMTVKGQLLVDGLFLTSPSPNPPFEGERDLVAEIDRLQAQMNPPRWVTVFSPDSRLIATVFGTVIVWDANHGHQLYVLSNQQTEFINAAFSPDSTRLVTAARNGTAVLWDVSPRIQASTQLAVLGSPGSGADELDRAVFSPDGSRIVTVNLRGNIALWDAKECRLIAML